MDYDVIIIGAGMAGLAAGIRLAHFGRKVCICERHSLVGGLNSWYRRHGRELDVGLHAMTNFADRRRKDAPLNRLLRQLRLDYAELNLVPQGFSLVRFPQEELRFSNDFAEFAGSVARTFPGQYAGFSRLVETIKAYDALNLEAQAVPAKAILRDYITDPLLLDMLLCPLMYYGSATPDDMDFAQFCIMFRSIFLEGFARPAGGIRPFLNLLLSRYREAGGELRMNCGVRRIVAPAGVLQQIELDDGTTVRTEAVLSSAGFVETLGMCDPVPVEAESHPRGQLAFMETVFVLNQAPAALGYTPSILFFNSAEQFHFSRPSTLVDTRSGVLCVPGNFAYPEPAGGDAVVRLTHLVDYEPWFRMDDEVYQETKDRLLEEQVRFVSTFIPGLAQHLVCTDMFTPRTILRFTGHLNGAIYGSPVKVKHGGTPVQGVFVCGTDQGFLGIVGAMLSGVSIVNRYLLK